MINILRICNNLVFTDYELVLENNTLLLNFVDIPHIN